MQARTKFVDLDWLESNFPCMQACPVHTPAGRYVALIAEGRYRGSLPLRALAQPAGVHLRAGLRTSLRDCLPPRKVRLAYQYPRAETLSHRTARSGIAQSGRLLSGETAAHASRAGSRHRGRTRRTRGGPRSRSAGIPHHHLRCSPRARRHARAGHSRIPLAPRCSGSAGPRDSRSGY